MADAGLTAQLARIETLIRQLQGALGGNRVVRGIITSTGAIAAGTGFSVNKTGTGVYVITFDPVFSDTPAVTPTAGQSGGLAAIVTAVSPSTVTVVTVNGSVAAADLQFHFHAVGPA